MLLSFACALTRKVVKNLLKHHKKFYHGHPMYLYEQPATINFVNVIRNHSGLLQESWPDSSTCGSGIPGNIVTPCDNVTMENGDVST